MDMVESYICQVSFKNAFYRRTNELETEIAEWEKCWTTGRHGLCSWPAAIAELRKRQYVGNVVLAAEYDDEGSVERLTCEDLAFIRSLFEQLS